MKTLALKLFIIICCGDYNGNSYHYEAKSLTDTSTIYTVYSTTKYNVGDTLQYKEFGSIK